MALRAKRGGAGLLYGQTKRSRLALRAKEEERVASGLNDGTRTEWAERLTNVLAAEESVSGRVRGEEVPMLGAEVQLDDLAWL